MIPLKDDNPTERFPFLTIALVVLNLAVFGWQLSLPSDEFSNPALEQFEISERDQANFEYGAIPARITDPGDECAVAALPAPPGQADGRVGGTPVAVDIVCGSTTDLDQTERSAAIFSDFDGAPWILTLLTSMFMHGGILHIAGNLLFLWVFGNNIEDSMSRPKFLLFYLAGGLAAVYAQALIDPGQTVPTIGASGAVAGVLGAYALLHPKARVLSLVFIIFFVTLVRIPAAILLGIWFLLQFLPAVGQAATPEVFGEGGVAYFAHVGGFLFGLAAIKLFADSARIRDPEPPYPVY